MSNDNGNVRIAGLVSPVAGALYTGFWGVVERLEARTWMMSPKKCFFG